jgi:hypothetical protein
LESADANLLTFGVPFAFARIIEGELEGRVAGVSEAATMLVVVIVVDSFAVIFKSTTASDSTSL